MWVPELPFQLACGRDGGLRDRPLAFPDTLRRRQRPFRVGDVVPVRGRTTLQDGLAVLEVG